VTSILTWNIQCGLGVDGRVDLARVGDVIKGMGDTDIICLQEVSRFDCEMDGGKGADQVSVLSTLFPDHYPSSTTTIWQFDPISIAGPSSV
jgi:endonuclease/exonuclease/phosphatase family metal-dependent hydrolase